MKANVLPSWETLTHFVSFLCSGLEERLWRAVWVDPSKQTPQVRFGTSPPLKKKKKADILRLKIAADAVVSQHDQTHEEG